MQEYAKTNADSEVTNAEQDEAVATQSGVKKCGIVMPISGSDGYPEQHWIEVKEIIEQALSDSGFETALVSDAPDSGVIHKRIVENLYDNPMVICDVSSRNPNVMFELGLRLAFDRPTVIISDDITPFSFDTSLIEHLIYPRDLRYSKITAFKLQLRDKVFATAQLADKDPNYSTFLKNFSSLKPSKLLSEEIPDAQGLINVMREELASVQESLSNQMRGILHQINGRTNPLALSGARIVEHNYSAAVAPSPGLSSQDHFVSLSGAVASPAGAFLVHSDSNPKVMGATIAQYHAPSDPVLMASDSLSGIKVTTPQPLVNEPVDPKAKSKVK